MKYLLVSLMWTTTVVFFTVATAVGQTPDGDTPAEETVCDPLKADGVTKGLYGLCVAFCEAQDIASEDLPLTDADLGAMEDEAPSGRILANYNRKKQEGDPEMPCIVVEEPCPCWSAEELASIDGFKPDGTSISNFCLQAINPSTGDPWIRQIRERTPENLAQAWTIDRDVNPLFACWYLNQQVTPVINRFLSEDAGTLTRGQAVECLAQVNAACDAAGF